MKTQKTQSNIETTVPAPSQKKVLEGIVVSTKMKDTIVVVVDRYVKNDKYQKFMKKSKRFKVDDKGNTAKEGDKVTIVECAPISKDKHFTLVK